MKPTPEDEGIARQLADRVRRVLDVRRVVWFGSRARGEGTIDSDWDLFVVAETRLDKWARIYLARDATEDVGVPRDIFVATPAEFAVARQMCGSLVFAAEADGVVLHE